MSLINISGTITQSHATASDVSSVTTLQQLSNVDLVNGLSNNQILQYNDGSGQWENNSDIQIDGSAYINNSGDIESSHSAWGGSAVKAASGIGGTPFYALRATTNTSWEPAPWGTGLYELKFDADLTGVNLDGTSQTVAFNFGDSNAAYSAAGLRATIRDPVITSGDIDTFDGTMSIFVSNHTSGGEDVYAPIELGSEKTSLVTVPGSAASSGWQNLHHIIMRDDPSSVSNWHATAYTAQTPTDQQDLALTQVVTTAVTLDSNNDYTDFSNDYEVWVTDLVAGSLSWYNPITASPGETLINPKLIITKDESDSSKAVAAMFNIKRKYDFDLTGHDINGDLIQAQQRLIDQSDASYPVSRQQSRINGVSIDGNGDIDDFEGSYRIQVTDVASKSMTHTNVVEFKSSAIESLVPVTSVNMDTTARNNLTAAAGMTIFNTTTSKLETYDGSAWQAHW